MAKLDKDNIKSLSDFKNFYVVVINYNVKEIKTSLEKPYFKDFTDQQKIDYFKSDIVEHFDTREEAEAFAKQKKFEKRIKELGESGKLTIVIDGCKTFLEQIINSYEAHDSIVDTKDHETQLLFSAFLIENAKFGIDNDDKTIIHGMSKDLSDRFKSMLLFVKENETHATLFTDMEANIRAMCVGCKFIAQDSDRNTIDIISDVFDSQKYLGGK